MGLEREEPCRMLLERYLRGVSSSGYLEWERGPDPPDYWMTYDGQRYAVEMTSTSYRRPDANGHLCREDTYLNSFAEFESELRKAVEDAGGVNGCYRVHSIGPMVEMNKRRRRLIRRILDYIHQTAAMPIAPEMLPLLEMDDDSIAIQKFGRQPSHLFVTYGGDAVMVGEVPNITARLIREAAEAKAKRAANQPQTPWILVIQNTYPFAHDFGTPGLAFSQAKMEQVLEAFHRVFIALSAEVGFFLKSSISEWLPKHSSGSLS